MALTIYVPLNNGDGSFASFELTLPVGAPSGAYAWSSGVTATGTIKARTDGRSALFTPVAVNTSTPTVITATVTNGPSGLTSVWAPGKFFYLNDEILDSNGHVQKVTAASKYAAARYTPNAGAIPGSISLVLTGGSASSGTGQVVISSISAAVPSTFLVGQQVTISGCTSTAAPLNGTWTLLASAAHSLTLSYNGSALVGVSVTAASTAYVPGDATIFGAEQTGADSTIASSFLGQNSDAQYGTVLNQGQGSNGDWPFDAIAANSGNILKPTGANPYVKGYVAPGTAAPVGYVACGYTSGASIGKLGHPLPSGDSGYAGVSTPQPIVAWQRNQNYPLGFVVVDEGGKFQQVIKAGTSGTQYPAFGETTGNTTTEGSVTWKNTGAAPAGYSNSSTYVVYATYSEIGPSGNIAYYVYGTTGFTAGWMIQDGAVIYAEPAVATPAFSTGGGSVVDGDLTWTDQGAASNTTPYSGLSIVVAPGSQPIPYGTYSVL